MLDTFQKFLDDMSETAMADDYARYRTLITVPMVVVSEHGMTIVDEDEQFRHGFECYSSMLKKLGATHLIRLAHAVTQYAPNLITGRYETHVLSGGSRVFGPFQSSASLIRTEQGWKLNSLVNPVNGDAWPTGGIAAGTEGKGAR
ncbi:MAG: hypothetical protein ACWA47_10355 [Brevirhabdus sp.]